MRVLVLDVETNGFPAGRGINPSQFGAYPLVISFAYLVLEDWKETEFFQTVLDRTDELSPDQWNRRAEEVHGISWEWSKEAGMNHLLAFNKLTEQMEKANCIIAHNLKAFDLPIIQAEYYRSGVVPPYIDNAILFDTMTDQAIIEFVGATRRGGRLKWPNLNEMYRKCFGKDIENAHNAGADTKALAKSVQYLVQKKVIELQ